MIENIKHILQDKYKISSDNINNLIKQYNIDDSMSCEKWAEIIYFYETL